ncbi:hypothetical protein BK126_26570 [Paenibacillus sp. FSL H7-0326]|uniref:hypothetical protein n=1 Tax=Paenibacillus sp. FSL H7-0326 TaxID=1921144 RepID=UPI00096C7C05|nr:hypothetical protein [Paenibacillus sp. FSL H7-0326]OMC63760.1 hypothetical protein BK126_26570 [Paenibacillus sp. FSL H7-0326]
MARAKREKGSKTGISMRLPVTSKSRLELIYDKLKSRVGEDETHPSRTDILTTLIIQKKDLTFADPKEKENEIRMADFMDQYILEHFGEDPNDDILDFAQSEALKAYYRTQGFEFNNSESDDDDEGFIYPSSIKD